MPSQIQIIDCDPLWPEVFRREADRLRLLLGCRALQIEHTGSTSVPGLAAKPIIDILLVVADSSDESAYVPILEHAGYSLRIREPNWHEHRMFKGPAADINLHVFLVAVRKSIAFYIFGTGCAAIAQIVIFTNKPNGTWQKKNGRMSRVTPMPRPRSFRQSLHERLQVVIRPQTSSKVVGIGRVK